MENTILTVTDLTKNYGNLKAVDSISFSVQEGEIYGILGPNGSGKTTTLGILMGVLNQSGGTFSWFGNGTKDANRLRIGTLLETPNFYPYLNAKDNLSIIAKIKQVTNEQEAIDHVLEVVDLKHRVTTPFRAYSLGMKQRLAIAAALLSNPDVLVLDEPTNGLDPVGIADIRRIIQSIANQGKTIILASHILDEMEKICTRVSIMRNGKILKTERLKDLIGSKEIIHIKHSALDQVKLILEKYSLHLMEQTEEELIFSGQEIDGSKINELLAKENIFVDQLYIRKRSLETVFLELLTEHN